MSDKVRLIRDNYRVYRGSNRITRISKPSNTPKVSIRVTYTVNLPKINSPNRSKWPNILILSGKEKKFVENASFKVNMQLFDLENMPILFESEAITKLAVINPICARSFNGSRYE